MELSKQLVGHQLWQKVVVQALPTTLQNSNKVDKQLQKVIKVRNFGNSAHVLCCVLGGRAAQHNLGCQPLVEPLTALNFMAQLQVQCTHFY